MSVTAILTTVTAEVVIGELSHEISIDGVQSNSVKLKMHPLVSHNFQVDAVKI